MNVVEIGAGFGGLTYWMSKIFKGLIDSYVIIDLPIMNVLQGYYLGKLFGFGNVTLAGESSKPILNTMNIHIPPPCAIKTNKQKIDLLINQDSMPEMSYEAVCDYILWAKKHLDGIFYSYNHECAHPVNGIPQVIVPDIVKKVAGFSCVTRSHSWLRKGYIEEIYTRCQPIL